MKSRLTFKLDANNVREVGPYFTPMWDLFVNESYVGEFWGYKDHDMTSRFLGRNGITIVQQIITRLQKIPKYPHA